MHIVHLGITEVSVHVTLDTLATRMALSAPKVRPTSYTTIPYILFVLPVFTITTSFQSLSLTLAVPLMESAQVNRPVSSKMVMVNVSTLVWNSGPVLEMQFVTSKMNYLSV